MPLRLAPLIAVLVPLLAGLGPAPGPTAIQVEPVPATRHRVDLGGNRFVPARLAITIGDTVDFVNGAGGPHNVAFWGDSLPAGTRDRISQLMPDSIAPLIGGLLFEEEQTWTMAFTGVPPGRYAYYCLPHVAGGMVGEIQVREEK
jgi:plastocyanin